MSIRQGARAILFAKAAVAFWLVPGYLLESVGNIPSLIRIIGCPLAVLIYLAIYGDDDDG